MTRTLLFSLFASFVFDVVQTRSIDDAKKGCTAPSLLPNLPFFVVWNIPSGDGCHLNLPAYRFVINTNNSFFGENMNILYGIGDIPFFKGANETPINGGLPQEGDLNKHLVAEKKVIEKYIPDPNFSGLVVFDFESWRPHLQWNFGSESLYQIKSYELVEKQHPTWTNKTQIHAEATRQFDTAARLFLGTTLDFARDLRPYGHFGYYGYPRCWGSSSTNVCGKGTAESNDKYVSWMFRKSSGLYPRIYTHRSTPLHNRYLYVRQTVNETLRVQVKWSGLYTPVMPYTLSQDNGTDFFLQEDLRIAIEEPADMGASGVVIWGSSGFFHTPGECEKMRDDVKNVLGPFVKNLTDFAQSCARNLCHNHGRCVSKEYEAQTQEFLRLNQKTSCVRPREEYENIASRRHAQFGENLYGTVRKYDNYICRCLAGWYGEYCDKSA